MSLYNNLVALSKDYLGPAGQKFLDRQIADHLNMQIDQLSSANLDELAKWCFIGCQFIIKEEEAKEYSNKIKACT